MIVIHLDTRDLMRWADIYDRVPAVIADKVVVRSINWTGDRARTAVARALAEQMGLPYGSVRRELRTLRATKVDPNYQIIGKGGPLPLSRFQARETTRGVSARPWGKRRIFRGTFLAQGFGVAEDVFRRIGGRREKRVNARGETYTTELPIDPLWGPSIPDEIIKDRPPREFENVIRKELPTRAAHELARLLPRRPQGL